MAKETLKCLYVIETYKFIKWQNPNYNEKVLLSQPYSHKKVVNEDLSEILKITNRDGKPAFSILEDQAEYFIQVDLSKVIITPSIKLQILDYLKILKNFNYFINFDSEGTLEIFNLKGKEIKFKNGSNDLLPVLQGLYQDYKRFIEELRETKLPELLYVAINYSNKCVAPTQLLRDEKKSTPYIPNDIVKLLASYLSTEYISTYAVLSTVIADISRKIDVTNLLTQFTRNFTYILRLNNDELINNLNIPYLLFLVATDQILSLPIETRNWEEVLLKLYSANHLKLFSALLFALREKINISEFILKDTDILRKFFAFGDHSANKYLVENLFIGEEDFEFVMSQCAIKNYPGLYNELKKKYLSYKFKPQQLKKIFVLNCEKYILSPNSNDNYVLSYKIAADVILSDENLTPYYDEIVCELKKLKDSFLACVFLKNYMKQSPESKTNPQLYLSKFFEVLTLVTSQSDLVWLFDSIDKFPDDIKKQQYNSSQHWYSLSKNTKNLESILKEAIKLRILAAVNNDCKPRKYWLPSDDVPAKTLYGEELAKSFLFFAHPTAKIINDIDPNKREQKINAEIEKFKKTYFKGI